jgi:hypothetical protein
MSKPRKPPQPRKYLTVTGVATKVATAERQQIRDAQSPLYLIIQPKPSGSKSWRCVFDGPMGRLRS